MKIIGPMAGVGARLRPFTYSKPKGFLKVAGKRVIDHILDLFQEVDQPNTDLLIIIGYQNRTIRDYLSEKYKSHFKIAFTEQIPKGYLGDIPFYNGLGEAIYCSEKWYSSVTSYDSKDPNDIALIFLSDMVPLDGFKILYDAISGANIESSTKDNLSDDFKDEDEKLKKKTNKSTNKVKYDSDLDGILAVMRVPKERSSSYGILEVDKKTGLITRAVEKPKDYISDLAIAGFYAFKPKTMKRIYYHLKKEVEDFRNKEGEAQFTPAIQALIDEGFKIGTIEFHKEILDFGKPDTLLEGNKFLLKKQDTILGGPIENISDSSLTSPSFIGQGTEISNCVIGPYSSIGDNCILKDCILKNSVIGDGCVLERIITQNSIVGDYVTMDNLIKDNMIIGDRSNIRSSS
jgi:glucose-1-phosphate thymidylyltransferase